MADTEEFPAWIIIRQKSGKSASSTPFIVEYKFTYLGSSVESTEKDIDTRLTKAWTAINRLSIIWKSDLTDKMKRSFFQAAVTSILLYGGTTWTLTKRLENKLDGNYRRMLRAILNKSWRQHPTRHQLYGHLPPITKTIQVRRTRHAGHCWRSRDELIRDVLLWTPPYIYIYIYTNRACMCSRVKITILLANFHPIVTLDSGMVSGLKYYYHLPRIPLQYNTMPSYFSSHGGNTRSSYSLFALSFVLFTSFPGTKH